MYVCTRTFVSDNVLRVMERVCVCGGGGGGERRQLTMSIAGSKVN